ncbi:hypothetical protein FB45DRAFT_871209 [Roridomyces roridus]|uniref:Uncharacterized protein n=1 Tax=Roridomyces roridus TaxID=1738132 RepID=A0AAD7BG01_9AGAR|nr:hypothetical protein FB45DRAFT_871209 [Roridomyces roridus]
MNIRQTLKTDIRIRTNIDGKYSCICKQYSRIFASGNYSDSAPLDTHLKQSAISASESSVGSLKCPSQQVPSGGSSQWESNLDRLTEGHAKMDGSLGLADEYSRILTFSKPDIRIRVNSTATAIHEYKYSNYAGGPNNENLSATPFFLLPSTSPQKIHLPIPDTNVRRAGGVYTLPGSEMRLRKLLRALHPGGSPPRLEPPSLISFVPCASVTVGTIHRLLFYSLILAEDTCAVDTGFYKFSSVEVHSAISLLQVLVLISPYARLLKLRTIGLDHFAAIRLQIRGTTYRRRTSAAGYEEEEHTAGISVTEDEEIAAARGILEGFDLHEDDGNSGIDVYCRAFLACRFSWHARASPSGHTSEVMLEGSGFSR